MTLLLLLACASDPPPPPPPPPAGAHQEDTLLGKVEGVSFVGDWTSPPCGGRTYARNIRFDVEQHYSVIDLVDPCPVGKECAWSGMIGFEGLWELDGKVLKTREIGVPIDPGGPRPAKFEATTDGKLVENGCLYTKGLTVPPGYTEDRVRPDLP